MENENRKKRVQFTVPSFNLKGKTYQSKEVQELASSFDPEALSIVAELISSKSRVIKIVNQ